MARFVPKTKGSCVHGIVFDMDGVIVDSHPAHRRAWKQFLHTVGRETTEEELDFILDGRKREEILRYFLGHLSPRQICEYGNRKDEMLRRLGDETRPVEGVIEFVASLKQAGLRTAMATSAGRTRACGTLNELGLLNCFDAIITGDEVHLGKPDPAIYRLAAERLGEDPKYLLAIEDAISGVKAATGAGMRCVGIAQPSRAEQLRAVGAEPVVSHFRSLELLAMFDLPTTVD